MMGRKKNERHDYGGTQGGWRQILIDIQGRGGGEIRHQQGDEPRQLQRTGNKEKRSLIHLLILHM